MQKAVCPDLIGVWDLKAQFEKYNDSDVFDCMVAEFLLSDGRFVPALDETLLRYTVESLEELTENQIVGIPEVTKPF